MMVKPIIRLSLALSALVSSSVFAAPSADNDLKTIKGQTYCLAKKVVSSEQLFTKKSPSSTKRALPPCTPTPPVSFSVPVQNPAAPAVTFFPNNSVVNALVAPPQTVGTNFTAADIGIGSIFVGTPPGPMGVVGPQQFFLAGDAGTATFNKAGALDGLMDIDVQSFTNNDGDFLLLMDFDWAHVRYDSFSDRFFYVKEIFDDFAGTNSDAGFTIAVSDSGVITNATKWTVVDVFNQSILPDSTGCPGNQGLFLELPQIGVDQHALYIGESGMLYNFGDPAGGLYATNSAFVVQKASLLNDGPVVITVFRDIVGFPGDQSPIRVGSGSITGVDNFDTNPQFGYFIGIDPQFFGRINLYRVINPGSKNPTLSVAIPLDVPRTASSNTTIIPFSTNLYGDIGALGSIDDSFSMAHVRNKELYTVQQILVNANGVGDTAGDRTGFRWYQIDLTGVSSGTGTGTETATSAVALVQAGTLFDPAVTNPLFYNIPSIMTNTRGDMVIAGTISSAANSAVPLPPSAFFVGRLAGDALGTLRIGTTRTGTVYGLGSGSYSRLLNGATNGGQPWGPFSNTSLDPADGMTMWTIQEIVRNGLETQVVAQLLAP